MSNVNGESDVIPTESQTRPPARLETFLTGPAVNVVVPCRVEDGGRQLLGGVAIDVTGQRTAEEALKDREQQTHRSPASSASPMPRIVVRAVSKSGAKKLSSPWTAARPLSVNLAQITISAATAATTKVIGFSRNPSTVPTPVIADASSPNAVPMPKMVAPIAATTPPAPPNPLRSRRWSV